MALIVVFLAYQASLDVLSMTLRQTEKSQCREGDKQTIKQRI
jgi:hypothetical protein